MTGRESSPREPRRTASHPSPRASFSPVCRRRKTSRSRLSQSNGSTRSPQRRRSLSLIEQRPFFWVVSRFDRGGLFWAVDSPARAFLTLALAGALPGSQRAAHDECPSGGSGGPEQPPRSIAFQPQQAANDHDHAGAGTEYPTPSTHDSTPPSVSRLGSRLPGITDQKEETQ